MPTKKAKSSPPAPAEKSPPSLDFSAFLDRLRQISDPARLAKALLMLKAERFQLFAEVEPGALVGVVRAQSSPTRVYSCRLASDGRFACCTQNLRICGGLCGAVCKHILVLVVGLTRAGQLEPAAVEEWVRASRRHRPVIDPDVMSPTFLRYKGAEAGEVDWRPTETIPEDYYAL
jgi:hypothetical protein